MYHSYVLTGDRWATREAPHRTEERWKRDSERHEHGVVNRPIFTALAIITFVPDILHMGMRIFEKMVTITLVSVYALTMCCVCGQWLVVWCVVIGGTDCVFSRRTGPGRD